MKIINITVIYYFLVNDKKTNRTFLLKSHIKDVEFLKLFWNNPTYVYKTKIKNISFKVPTKSLLPFCV